MKKPIMWNARMMESIMVHEWIGRRAKITEAPNRTHAGLEGVVVDETLGTITLRGKDGRERMVPKKGAKIVLSIDSGEQVADGTAASVRPEDRAKKLYRKIKG